MDKSLIDYLKQIPEHRDPHGLRQVALLQFKIINYQFKKWSSFMAGATHHNYGYDEWLLGLSAIR